MNTPWRRRTRRAYNPTSFREADAAVARMMRDLHDLAFRKGLAYVGRVGGGGKWVEKVNGGVTQEGKE